MSKKDELFKDSRKKGYYSGFDDLRAELEEDAGKPEEATAAPPEKEESKGEAGMKSPAEGPVPSGRGEAEERPTRRLNLEIDEEVHRQFKGVVGMRGLTMTEVIEGFMRDYVEKARSELL